MPAFVLDCSVALSWFLPGEDNARTGALMDRTVDDEALATGLWPLEIANVLLIAERRKRITQIQRTRALNALTRLPILIDAETASRAWSGTFDLAAAHGLTIYDAGYLELSLRADLPLATLDKPLRRAAHDCGVAVLPDA